jgi:hypothetical protein
MRFERGAKRVINRQMQFLNFGDVQSGNAHGAIASVLKSLPFSPVKAIV